MIGAAGVSSDVELVGATATAVDREGRHATLRLDDPPPGTYTLRVTGARTYTLDVSGDLAPADSTSPALTLAAPPPATRDSTPLLSGDAGSAVGDFPGVVVRIRQERRPGADPSRIAGRGPLVVEAEPLATARTRRRPSRGTRTGTARSRRRRTFRVDTVAPQPTRTPPPAVTNDATPAIWPAPPATNDGTAAGQPADAARVTVQGVVGHGHGRDAADRRDRPWSRAAPGSHDVATALADGTYTIRVRQDRRGRQAGERTRARSRSTRSAPAPTRRSRARHQRHDAEPLRHRRRARTALTRRASADAAQLTREGLVGHEHGRRARPHADRDPLRLELERRRDPGAGRGHLDGARRAVRQRRQHRRRRARDVQGRHHRAGADASAPEGDTNDTTPNLSGTAGSEDGSHPARTADSATVTVRVWSGTSTERRGRRAR